MSYCFRVGRKINTLFAETQEKRPKSLSLGRKSVTLRSQNRQILKERYETSIT
jgi:hypothetical protein